MSTTHQQKEKNLIVYLFLDVAIMMNQSGNSNKRTLDFLFDTRKEILPVCCHQTSATAYIISTIGPLATFVTELFDAANSIYFQSLLVTTSHSKAAKKVFLKQSSSKIVGTLSHYAPDWSLVYNFYTR